MTRKKWYCIALFLPIVVPAIVMAIDMSLNGMLPHKNPPSSVFAWVSAILFGGLVIGGLQYLVFSAGLIFWGRNKTADQIKRIIWFLPIIFAPVFTFGFILSTAVTGSALKLELGSLLLFTFLSFPNSYLYVAITVVLTRLLQKAGWVKD